MTEICEIHNEEKVIHKSGFKRGKQQIRQVCKTCNREHQSKWWNENKIEQQDRVKKNRKRLKLVGLEYKLQNPCIICNETNPLCLDFDHLRDKEKEVSQMILKGASTERVLKEISKCQVLCSNCHRIKTAIEQNNVTYIHLKQNNLFTEQISKIEELINKTNSISKDI